MSADPQHVGAFLERQAEELTRIWRLARAGERPDVFPGLLDGVLESFFARAGTGLAAGGTPEDAFAGVEGVLRWPPAIAPAEHDAEWALAAEVLRTACDSVNADPAANAWLDRALEAARAATVAIDGGLGPAPRNVVVVLVWSSVVPVART